MKAWVVDTPRPLEENPLTLKNLPTPVPAPGQIKVRVLVCGICRTDLHVVEGDLPQAPLPIIPGHEIVGKVEAMGEGCSRFRIGERVGIAWMNRTCGKCEWCGRGEENLCPDARYTGWTAPGGFTEYVVIDEAYAYFLPDTYDDEHTAPLLCAGIVGFKAVSRGGVKRGERVGIYGFGASAHLVLQVLVHWGCKVFVFSRSQHHRDLAMDLGAVWVGKAGERPPERLHRALIYAPAGWIMVEALKDVAPGGVVVSGGIHMSDIPAFPYELLFQERTLTSVAHATRRDGENFLRIAGEVPLRVETEIFDFEDLPRALARLKEGSLKAAGVLRVAP